MNRMGCYLLGIVASIIVSFSMVDPSLCQGVNLPASTLMIVPPGGPGLFAPRTLVSQDLYQAGSCPSGQVFVNNAGLIGCASPLALAVAGTSGGIPYFNSGTTWASSGALAANQIVVGGGAGAAPSTPAGLGTTTQVLHGNASGAPSFGSVVFADTNFTALGVNSAGMVGDGSTNNNTAFSNILTALGGSGEISLPCGVYKFTTNFATTITAGKRIKLSGASSECTTLFSSGTTAGINFTWGSGSSSLEVSGISFTTDDATGANTAITLTNSTMIATGGPPTVFRDVVFHGSDGFGATDYWGNGISSTTVDNINIDNVWFYGGTANKGNWIVTNSTNSSNFEAVVNVVHSGTYQCNIGFQYGAFVQGVVIDDDNFTACKIGINVPSSLSALNQLVVSNSQFNMSAVAGNNAIAENTNVPNTFIHDNTFIVPANGNGVAYSVAANQLIVSNNSFGGANTTNTVGVNFGLTGGSQTLVTDNIFGTFSSSIAYVSGTVLNANGNAFNNVTNAFNGSATVIAYGNAPESQYTISTLPACATATFGLRLTINNGVASPTYHAAPGTTGAVWSPVYCTQASTWAYD